MSTDKEDKEPTEEEVQEALEPIEEDAIVPEEVSEKVTKKAVFEEGVDSVDEIEEGQESNYGI